MEQLVNEEWVEQVIRLRAVGGSWLRPELRTLKATGPDRVRFLNGMLSNDVERLHPGEGQISVKLNQKGRVEGIVRLRASDQALFLDIQETSFQRVWDAIERFKVMDDCTFRDVSAARVVIAFAGPKAKAWPGASALARFGFTQTERGLLVRDDALGVPGFELHVPSGQEEVVLSDLASFGLARVTPEAVEVLRVEAGVVLDGVDVDEDNFPMEARLDEALDFKKGCYLGQEVVARATHLGGVKHILVGISFDEGQVPEGSLALRRAGQDKPTGEVRSRVFSPELGRFIGLGYVRRTEEAPGTVLDLVTDDGAVAGAARVCALPFLA
jgi:folate-binding protein YgfZ